jgi:hypothetical protein
LGFKAERQPQESQIRKCRCYSPLFRFEDIEQKGSQIIEKNICTQNEYQLTDGLQLMLEYGERMKVEFVNNPF